MIFLKTEGWHTFAVSKPSSWQTPLPRCGSATPRRIEGKLRGRSISCCYQLKNPNNPTSAERKPFKPSITALRGRPSVRPHPDGGLGNIRQDDMSASFPKYLSIIKKQPPEYLRGSAWSVLVFDGCNTCIINEISNSLSGLEPDLS